MSATGINGCGDGRFGPGLGAICRGGFDFTLLFEDSILNLLPASCLLLLAPVRIWQLARRRNFIRRSRTWHWKLLSAGILVVTYTVSLGFAATHQNALTRVALPAAVLDLAAGIALAALVHFEHFKSVRPSLLTCVFLSLTALLDVARLRTAWIQLPNTGWTASLTASLIAKLILLALESRSKESLLLERYQALSKESTSGPFNRALFLWLNRLLRTGWSAILRPDSLPLIDERLHVDQIYGTLHTSWVLANRKGRHALLVTLIKAFKWEMLAVAIPRLCVVGLSIAQPFMIGQTVTFLQNPATSSLNTGYGLLIAFVVVYISTAIATALFQHMGYRVMTMLRAGLIAILYDHMMNLPAESVDESGALGLMGADAEGFAEFFFATITDTWANVLQLGIAIYLLTRMVGAVVIAPVILAILFTLLAFQAGHMISGRQRTWFQATQRRVNFTTEILGRIRDAKILGLAGYLGNIITGLRREELKKSQAFRRVSSFKICLVNAPVFLGQFAIFAAYGIAAHLRGTGGLSVSEAVTALSLVNLLLTPLQELVYAIPETFSSMSCLRRIQEFLVQATLDESRGLGASFKHGTVTPQNAKSAKGGPPAPEIELSLMPGKTDTGGSSPDVSVRKLVFGSGASKDSNITTPADDKGLSFDTPAGGSLTMITGPVGCGKSTLLRAILGELTVLNGTVVLGTPEVAYCSQDPWVLNTSIRENIIGTPDSHVDAEWYTAVTTACAMDIDLARFPEGDRTLVGSKGTKLSGGQKQRIALARAVYSRKQIVMLDDVMSGLDNTTRSNVFHRVCGPNGLLRRRGTTVIMTAPHTGGQHLALADYIIVLGADGRVAEQGSFEQLRIAGSPIAKLDSGPASTEQNTEVADQQAGGGDTTNSADESEVDTLQSPDLSVWKYYFKAMGWTNILLFCLFVAVDSAASSVSYVWITWWSASPDAAPASNLGYWLGIYAMFGVLSLTGLGLGVYWTWVVIVPTASRTLHAAVLSATMGASISFLSKTDTGMLINRFSQDMRLVDMVLPRGFVSTGFHFFGAIAQAAVAISALPYLAPAIPVVGAVLFLIQRFYLRTSRQLRLLDIEMKAPVFSHFIESLHGLMTIRAFGWKPQYLARSISLLDAAQRPYYLLLAIQRWLTLVLNLVVAGLAILMVGLSLALRHRVQPGLLGVALVMMTDLGRAMADLIQNWTLLETSLGAISRIKDFSENTPQEEGGDGSAPTQSLPAGGGGGGEWPSSGAIEFSSVYARHDAAGQPVLKDINVAIAPGQKVGICGRTGSGKSSLMMSLLRLVQVESGRVAIDGVDIATIPPTLLRERLNCMTQEPFIFGGTVRENADPLEERSDAEILAALEAVGVLDVIASKTEECGPLERKMDEKLLSHGQKQLFAVARSLLRGGKVLLLDEPTSRLDAISHELVLTAIREHFRDCTVVMVAHRLDSLLDFDRVVVLDAGRVVEFDGPKALLADGNSAFSRLYRGGGKVE